MENEAGKERNNMEKMERAKQYLDCLIALKQRYQSELKEMWNKLDRAEKDLSTWIEPTNGIAMVLDLRKKLADTISAINKESGLTDIPEQTSTELQDYAFKNRHSTRSDSYKRILIRRQHIVDKNTQFIDLKKAHDFLLAPDSNSDITLNIVVRNQIIDIIIEHLTGYTNQRPTIKKRRIPKGSK